MKKQLFFVAVLAGVCCLAGCKQDQKVDPDEPAQPTSTKVTISLKEVILTAEEPTVRLAATITPEDATATIEWTSSDDEIATVTNRGIVEAQAYGDCYIYATVGDAKDSCHVFVKSYLETLVFNGAIVWDEDSTYAMDPETGELKVDTIQASDGTKYYAYKCMALLRVFSDGMYVNNSGRIDGTAKGTIVEVYAPMYYAPGRLNNSDNGTVFCLGEWNVTDDIKYMRQGEPGKISDEEEYVKQMKLFIESYNAGSASGTYLKAAGELFTGATLSVFEYDAEGGGYMRSYIPEAVCDEANMFLNGEYPASQYMCGMDFCEVKFTPLAYDWGMHLQELDDNSLVFVDEEIHWDDQIVTIYGERPAESKAFTPIHVPVISENPALKASLEQQIKEKGIYVIKAKKF